MNSIIDKLSGHLKLSDVEVKAILTNAPNKYKVYNIPKRTFGYRTIAHPEKRLKSLQRAFLSFSIFPIHDSAMAYIKGKSIKDNALQHAKNSYLLKMDFTNFFTSITPELFWNCWKLKWDLPKETEIIWLNRLLFWAGGDKINALKLSIGAPTSPMISNFCMLEFDKKINDLCEEHQVTYTRYADDLTFSSNIKGILFDYPKVVKNLLSEIYNSQISLNYSKTKFSSKAHNRHVTGITLTNNGEISLGRQRKRYIKHLVHKFNQNLIDIEDLTHLKGLLSFAKDIEPDFITSLEKKYTSEVINRILKNA